jgi:hypothetical protein
MMELTADQAKALSIEAARGLGFKRDRRTVERLRFVEPMPWLSAAAQLDVNLTSQGDGTAACITGSSVPGRNVASPGYLARSVAALAERLERSATATVQTGSALLLQRLERGAGLFTLVFIVVFIGLAGRPVALVPFGIAWATAVLPVALQSARRYKAGILGRRDVLRLLAYVVFLAAAVVGFLAYLRVI